MPIEQSIFAYQGKLDIAKTSDQLTGLTLAVKDLFDIAGVPTGAGNPDWLASHAIPKQTSSVVEVLLKAGAEFVGKSQTDELAYSLNGCNIHYGTPINPKATNRLPGGSSSGSAIAVANGQVDIGLGTDTGGSIRVPASYNGLFGLRTSHGVIAMDNMVPLAPMFDTVGWMTRDLDTLQKVAQVLLPELVSGEHTWTSSEPKNVAVLLPELDEKLLWREVHQTWLDSQTSFKQVKTIPVSSDWLKQASECFRILQGYNLWQTHKEWFLKTQPKFAPDIQMRIDWCQTISQQDFEQATQLRAEIQQQISVWFEQVDYIVMPTTPSASPLLDATDAWMANYRSELMGLTAPAGLAGLPQLHLPVLEDEEAPFGLSLLGPKNSDLALIHAAKNI
ncbi:amidase [Paraglaciecola aquimarina]|uniref:Amidase n=1 Tax=Paraglaciecola algarum TaxID=3050085 RepID=A0ABS9D6X7_9ALTE|nr:amidase [Paraglaciecola sp. G1-23]MCF2948703.1 amidase [Paraglaciecola sp. G1-23]